MLNRCGGLLRSKDPSISEVPYKIDHCAYTLLKAAAKVKLCCVQVYRPSSKTHLETFQTRIARLRTSEIEQVEAFSPQDLRDPQNQELRGPQRHSLAARTRGVVVGAQRCPQYENGRKNLPRPHGSKEFARPALHECKRCTNLGVDRDGFAPSQAAFHGGILEENVFAAGLCRGASLDANTGFLSFLDISAVIGRKARTNRRFLK